MHNPPETDHEAANNVQGGEARDGAFVASGEFAEAVHPSVGALDHPPKATQVVVLKWRSTELPAVDELAFRNARSDTPLGERLTERPTVIPFVGSQTLRSASMANMNPVNSRERLAEIVDIAGRKRQREGDAVAIRQTMTLRGLVAELG